MNNIRCNGLFILCAAFLLPGCFSSENESKRTVDAWITTGDKEQLFSPSLSPIEFEDNQLVDVPVIEVDTSQRFQDVDGFGFTLTGGSAFLLHRKLSVAARDTLLRELFLTEGSGIGISYLRLSIGASDLDDHAFSYDDLPSDEADDLLNGFTLAPDKENLIPILKEILTLQPNLKIMGSPWSAPAWMKSNGSTKGGRLKPEYCEVYAQYLAKYIEAMASEGITIDAITLQNEPENPENNPSMLMTASEQSDFVKNCLVPTFEVKGLATKIVIYDHNADHPEYPISVLNDEEAKQYIDGSAFHLYRGEISALSKVHDAHPDRNLYFTEQWTSGKGDFGGDLRWHLKNIVVGATRNWSRTVLEWNLAADQEFRPHTDGGCTECLGALTIGDSIMRNVSYYIIAHASKFVRPGSVRVYSNITDNLHNVAFQDISGGKVLIVLNDNQDTKLFGIKHSGRVATASLPGGAVGTYVWD